MDNTDLILCSLCGPAQKDIFESRAKRIAHYKARHALRAQWQDLMAESPVDEFEALCDDVEARRRGQRRECGDGGLLCQVRGKP